MKQRLIKLASAIGKFDRFDARRGDGRNSRGRAVDFPPRLDGIGI
jgi:hypothetical protein